MKIGIIAAMEEELSLLLANLLDAQEHQVLSKTYYTGRFGKHELILVQSGVGKVMSAMTVAILVEHFKAQAIINTGSAGAVASHLAIGDVVVADRLVYHDVDATAFGYAYGQMAGQPLYYDCDPQFVAIFKQVLKHEKTNGQVGLIATGDSFVAGQDKIDQIKTVFSDVLAVEMEGAAIAQAAHTAGKPFIVVRAMSDTAAHDANITFDQFIIEAGKRSAQTLMTFLENLPV